MPTAIITGANGLIGSEAVEFFCRLGWDVTGIDNDLRARFFGPEASTAWRKAQLHETFPRYTSLDIDIRDQRAVDEIFARYSSSIELVIHAAAQPSHDWAAGDPFTDFSVNANGTLNLLEATRKHASQAVFIYTSTNKVYGDTPNRLPLIEQELRWEIDPTHRYRNGIDETMSVDQTLHSLFGVSKTAADILVQEYGRYFGLKTGVFRGGCLTGPAHSGAKLHGFLAYLAKCTVGGLPYEVLGYGGKQVRDNIHSFDLVNAFYHFYRRPKAGEVYNIGGGRHSNCSVLEAISLCEQVAGRRLRWKYVDRNRTGDHVWWISDVSKFRSHYPGWDWQYTLRDIVEQLIESGARRAAAVDACRA
ncbi:MAG TPA: NAD-dependent epimerase/dehydratase family protein [Bryobacteraceae bacterium]|nr:NAD-dependent epimerase/dehydratase family protein [Bryobacteraceae bacterium]